jgi:hypothetical protein
MDGCVPGDLALRQGARRENILYGSLSDEQRRSSAKDRGTLRAEFWRAADGVAPQSQNPVAMLLRRALPAAHHYSARPFLFMRWVLGRGRFNDLQDKAFLLRTLARVVVRRERGRNAASDRGNCVAKFHFAIGREIDEHADAMTVW